MADLMTAEWESWRWVCRELEALGMDLNLPKHDRLAASLRLWGERLVALRIANPEHVEGARTQYENEYRELVKGEYPEI